MVGRGLNKKSEEKEDEEEKHNFSDIAKRNILFETFFLTLGGSSKYFARDRPHNDGPFRCPMS